MDSAEGLVFDSRRRLESARDRLADAIDVCESSRDLPGLIREYRAVIETLDKMTDAKEVDPVDELAKARQSRRGVS